MPRDLNTRIVAVSPTGRLLQSNAGTSALEASTVAKTGVGVVTLDAAADYTLTAEKDATLDDKDDPRNPTDHGHTAPGDGGLLSVAAIPGLVDSITLERDIDGYITKLSYESGREVNIARTSGELTSWEDGDYEWTVVRDDGKIVGVSVNKL